VRGIAKENVPVGFSSTSFFFNSRIEECERRDLEFGNGGGRHRQVDSGGAVSQEGRSSGG